MKATVVLFFFLGMSSLLFCINPNDKGIYEDAYMVTNAVLKGSQVLNFAQSTDYLGFCREALSAYSTVSSRQMYEWQ